MFRFRPIKTCKTTPSEVFLRVVKSEINSSGIEVQTVVTVPASQEHPPIPSPSDYKLSDLMAAGVPLNQLDAAIFDTGPSDSQIEALSKAIDDFNNDNVVEPEQNDK